MLEIKINKSITINLIINIISVIFSILITWIITKYNELKHNINRANDEIITNLLNYYIRNNKLELNLIHSIRNGIYKRYNFTKSLNKCFIRNQIYKTDHEILEILTNELVKLSVMSGKNYSHLINNLSKYKENLSEDLRYHYNLSRIELNKTFGNLVFSDDFESFNGWEQYKKGKISQSSDYKYKGNYSLKKDSYGDPHGGYKKFKESVHLNLKLSGWIFRPNITSPCLGDRLALENEDFKGYGFCLNHHNNSIWIERRDKGIPTPISPINYFLAPKNEWYYFEFILKRGERFNLSIYDKNKKILISIVSYVDNAFGIFDRVVIHGGFPFYVDELKVEKF